MDFKMGRNLFLQEGDDFSKNTVDPVAEEIHLEGRHKLEHLRKESKKFLEKPKTEVRPKTAKKSEEKSKTYKELLDEMMKKR